MALLTDETEVTGDSKRTNERGLLWLVRWACRAGTGGVCSALAAIQYVSGPVQKICFLTYTISMLLSSSASKLGRQPC